MSTKTQIKNFSDQAKVAIFRSDLLFCRIDATGLDNALFGQIENVFF